MQDNKAMLKPEFPVSGNSEDEKVYQENLKSYNAWKSTQPKIEDDKKLAKKLRAEIPDKAGNKPQIDFGDYVEIEQKRHGVKNEMYVHKVIGLVHSNAYVDVPVQCPATETLHGQITECVACICCGVQETEVRKYSLRDVKTIKRSPSPVQGIVSENQIIKILEGEDSHRFMAKDIIELFKKWHNKLSVQGISKKGEKVCTGCGHVSTDAIQPPYLSCCPDSNYLPLREFIEEWRAEIESAKKKIVALSSKGDDKVFTALQKAVEVIRGWHNMGSPSGRLTKEQIDLAWKIYYEHSPEMKIIREAIYVATAGNI